MSVTWVDATISGVARPTGGAENRLVYISDFSKELPDVEEFILQRDGEAAIKRLFLGTFSDFDTYFNESARPINCYSGTVTHMISCGRAYSWGRS